MGKSALPAMDEGRILQRRSGAVGVSCQLSAVGFQLSAVRLSIGPLEFSVSGFDAAAIAPQLSCRHQPAERTAVPAALRRISALDQMPVSVQQLIRSMHIRYANRVHPPRHRKTCEFQVGVDLIPVLVAIH